MLGAVLFAVSFLLLLYARTHRLWAEWYSTHVYVRLVDVVSRITGAIPVSVVELLLYLMIIGILVGIIIIIRKRILGLEWKPSLKRLLSSIWLLAGILFFLYTTLCGINYQRAPFTYKEGIEVEEYTKEELAEVCTYLKDQVNQYGELVDRDEHGLAVCDQGTKDVAVESMKHLGTIYPSMKGFYPIPKGLLVSRILSVQNLTGVYAPFTIEANYNQEMADYNIPFTMCHELSHLRGFMEEREANFIGYLACINSSDAEFQYSGNLLGWIYCSNLLYKLDKDAWKEIHDDLSEQVLTDLKYNNAFWQQYKGKISETSNKINDHYLKANGQAEGVIGYDRVVDLIVAYYKMKIK